MSTSTPPAFGIPRLFSEINGSDDDDSESMRKRSRLPSPPPSTQPSVPLDKKQRVEELLASTIASTFQMNPELLHRVGMEVGKLRDAADKPRWDLFNTFKSGFKSGFDKDVNAENTAVSTSATFQTPTIAGVIEMMLRDIEHAKHLTPEEVTAAQHQVDHVPKSKRLFQAWKFKKALTSRIGHPRQLEKFWKEMLMYVNTNDKLQEAAQEWLEKHNTN